MNDDTPRNVARLLRGHTPIYDALPEHEQELAERLANEVRIMLRVEGYIAATSEGGIAVFREAIAVLLVTSERRPRGHVPPRPLPPPAGS